MGRVARSEREGRDAPEKRDERREGRKRRAARAGKAFKIGRGVRMEGRWMMDELFMRTTDLNGHDF